MATVRRDVFRPLGCQHEGFDACNLTDENATTAVSSGASAEAKATWNGSAYTVRKYAWLHLETPITAFTYGILSSITSFRMITYYRDAALIASEDPGGDVPSYTGTVYGIKTDWDPTTLNWSNQPSLTAATSSLSLIFSGSVVPSGETYTEDISGDRRCFSMLAESYAPDTVYGFALVPAIAGSVQVSTFSAGYLVLANSFVLA